MAGHSAVFGKQLCGQKQKECDLGIERTSDSTLTPLNAVRSCSTAVLSLRRGYDCLSRQA